MIRVELNAQRQARRSSGGPHPARVGARVVRVVQQVAHEAAQLEVRVKRQPPPRSMSVAPGASDFARPRAVVFAEERHAHLGVARGARSPYAPAPGKCRARCRRDSIRRRSSSPRAIWAPSSDRVARARDRCCVSTSKPRRRALAAVPEEEEIGLRRVALDEVVDLVVVEEDADLGAAPGCSASQRSNCRLVSGSRSGLPVMKPRPDGPAEVAIRQRRVAEPARDLGGQAQAVENGPTVPRPESREGTVRRWSGRRSSRRCSWS